MKENGLVLHAKHAFMPNSLGYCGPDDRGRILQLLEEGKAEKGLLKTLKGFEAAYPFLSLIARNTGRDVFDASVPEAYWIGNSLLEKVPHSDFYGFSHRELTGKDPMRVRDLFKRLDGSAPPHHTFYVLSTYAGSTVADGPDISNERGNKVAELMDNCRISWAKVKQVRKNELKVEHTPIMIEGSSVTLAAPRLKTVKYNPEVKPFSSVRPGAVVSLHWNYACDVLSERQARNLAKYTEADLTLINRFLASKAHS
jgi:Family of unknown function (DUF6390)